MLGLDTTWTDQAKSVPSKDHRHPQLEVQHFEPALQKCLRKQLTLLHTTVRYQK